MNVTQLSLFADAAPQPVEVKPPAPKPQPVARPVFGEDAQFTETDIFHDFKRDSGSLPMLAPMDLMGELHFFDIHTRKAFCGTKTGSFASWFWCVTCKVPEDCPATFCPTCRAAFENVWDGQKI